MKKGMLFFFILVCIVCKGQETAVSLKVFDTRDIQDLPSFCKYSIRADFKQDKLFGTSDGNQYSGYLTVAPWGGDSGGFSHQLIFNNTGIYHRTGSIYNEKWHVIKKLLMTDKKGVLQSNLEVNGSIRAKEVKIEVTGWADFVFSPDYNLKPLSEVETFVKENKHLPDVPSEKQMQQEGLNLNEMQIKLLQKIEELTLYVIELDKKDKEKTKLIEKQDKLIQELQSKIDE